MDLRILIGPGLYEKGFGDLNGEFWYGLKAMNCLTQAGQWELRVDMNFPTRSDPTSLQSV